MKLPVTIRSPKPDELRVIQDAWKANYSNSRIFHQATRDWVYHACHALIDKVLRHQDTSVLVASPDQSIAQSDLILGFCVFSTVEPDYRVLHYVYTKLDYRNAGVGTALMDNAFDRFGYQEILCTHWSSCAYKQEKTWILKYDPSLLGRVVRTIGE